MSLDDTAVRLITKHGRAVSIQSSTKVLSDPNKPWGSTGDSETVTTEATYGVFLDESAADLQARLSAVSRLVLAPVEVNMTQVYVPARDLSSAPTISDKLVDGSRTLEIKQVGVVQPGTFPILYILKVEN